MDLVRYFFLHFNCQRRTFWVQQMKVLLVVLTLANISCANRRFFRKFMQPNARCQKTYNPHIDRSCETCGIFNGRHRGDFVINGIPVQPTYKYPWMVSLLKNGQKLCGGAIISNEFILTASHCVKKIEDQPHLVQIGFLTDSRELAPRVPIRAIYCHPKFNDDVFGLYDIALIRLQRKITCDKYKSPICLPRDNAILPPSTHLTLAGWGANIGGMRPRYPDELLEGSIQTTECERCKGLFHLRECTVATVYCMLGVNNQAACFGDSGSPMFLRIGGKFYIEGVTAGGDAECTLGRPFVFAGVSASRSWIRQVTGI